ncbi:MAG: peptide chain release factor N(5)-glutamine methyltransferase [Acutalibacteraceae bacterium]
MTVFELYKQCGRFLKENSVENAEAEARLLCELACNIVHESFLFERDRTAFENEAEKAFDFCKRRVTGMPIQYILEKWEFMGLDFSVGEGVLIPRPETEQLCSYVIDKIKNKSKCVVFDLCAGSGCIGLSIKHYVPQAEVYLIEKSQEAGRFLELNRTRLNLARQTVGIIGDITGGYESFSFLPQPDVIVSNPPYIISNEIPLLQKEVQKEPVMALDGGEDGFDFYRILSQKWLPYIKKGGFMAVECGENQADEISSLFSKNSEKTEIINDFNSIERFVAAFR